MSECDEITRLKAQVERKDFYIETLHAGRDERYDEIDRLKAELRTAHKNVRYWQTEFRTANERALKVKASLNGEGKA